MIYYRNLGYSEEWINAQLQSIQFRKELTDEWKRSGVKEGVEFAILPRVYSSKFKDVLLEYVGPKENGLPATRPNEFLLPELLEVIVPKSEQIYILGSQADLENFKKFIRS